jgi:uncharacterized protein
MPSICHFEIPADDEKRAKAFYEKLFDWKIEAMPGMEYFGIKTGDKTVGGGMMKRQDPKQPITIYIDVDDLDAHVGKVEQLGGSIIMGKTPVPGMGWFAICLDTENNCFGIFQVDDKAK